MPGFFFTTTNDNLGQQKNKKVVAVDFIIAYHKNGGTQRYNYLSINAIKKSTFLSDEVRKMVAFPTRSSYR